MSTILVVDDSPVDRRLISGVLQKGGRFQIVTANNGADALAKLADFQPDVIVTDLTMPEMDGLQLVTAVRIQHSRVPVILITAHGSEALAVQALEQGAASYVPKPQLAQKLLDTVEQVLARNHADEAYERLTSCMTQAEFSFRLPNHESLFERLVDLVQSIAVSMGLCDPSEQVRLGMALEEALASAVFHGNLELSPDELLAARLDADVGIATLEKLCSSPRFAARRVHVHVRLSPDEGSIRIRHEGRVQPISSLTDVRIDINEPANRCAVLLQAMMDKVIYSEDGREVTLVKRRKS